MNISEIVKDSLRYYFTVCKEDDLNFVITLKDKFSDLAPVMQYAVDYLNYLNQFTFTLKVVSGMRYKLSITEGSSCYNLKNQLSDISAYLDWHNELDKRD